MNLLPRMEPELKMYSSTNKVDPSTNTSRNSIKNNCYNSEYTGDSDNKKYNEIGICCSKPINSIMQNTLLLEQQNNILVERVTKSLRDLSIEIPVSEEAESTNGIYHFVGKVQNIIKTMNVIIVQPSSPDSLLYIGTPLFLMFNDMQKDTENSAFPLGRIDDVFGSIADPMYLVYISDEFKNELDIGSNVFYTPTHYNTRLMYVERTVDNITTNITKHKIITKSS